MADVKLTERQKRFADFYIECGNATEAARRAGYSVKTAKVIGCENLTKPNISEYIAKHTKLNDDTRIATAEEVLQTLTRILRREEKEAVVVTLKSRSSGYDKKGKKVIKETEMPTIVEIPTKLSDVNRAAEALAKRFGLTSPDETDSRTVVQFIDDIPKESI